MEYTDNTDRIVASIISMELKVLRNERLTFERCVCDHIILLYLKHKIFDVKKVNISVTMADTYIPRVDDLPPIRDNLLFLYKLPDILVFRNHDPMK